MKLSYTTFLARDVGRLAQFYIDGLGLAEIEASRDERYREVAAGGCLIGFAPAAARPLLNLDGADPVGTRSILTFDVGEVTAMGPAIAAAVAAGATVTRPAINTPFGQHQAVLLDPEGNAFRLSAKSGR